MKTITKEEFNAILEKRKHDPFSLIDLRGANLCCADLRGANLRSADLNGANLRCADLSGADLRCADLSGADLYNAKLIDTNLSLAELCGVNLSYSRINKSDLHKANLSGANLEEADLRGSNLDEADLNGIILSGHTLYDSIVNSTFDELIPIACPEKGSFIGYKKACGYIVELLVTDDSLRSSATTRKCRCSKAKVLSITTLNGDPSGLIRVASNCDSSFIYEVGKTVEVPNFNVNRWDECSTGIHFFITRNEAIKYKP